MSRIGKKIIEIPSGAEVKFGVNGLTAKGPKGELSVRLPQEIGYSMEDGKISFSRESDEKHIRAKHGLARALAASAIEGVTNGFSRTLQIEGVGFRSEMRGDKLLMYLGFSHPVVFIPPDGIKFETTSPTVINVSGIDKQLVGQIASKIRKIRPPEPYKGKGVRYKDEQIRRKAGKSGGKGK